MAADAFRPPRSRRRAPSASSSSSRRPTSPARCTSAMRLLHDARGHADPLSPHARRRHAVAARASTTPASPPSSCSTRSSPRRARHARRSAASATSSGCGSSWTRRATISLQHRRFGASADWSRERFTMDEGSARAVRVAFKRLWDAGLVYRGEALVNWCPRCLTTISDLENVHREETGTLWTIRYHLEREDGTPDPDAWISVATTRPETLLGDTAVAVHPDDERYRRARRPRRHPAVPRAPPADRRRRAGRARVRHRRGEDHAGARPRRLRARQAPRAAGDQRPRRGGADQRATAATSSASTATRRARRSSSGSARWAISRPSTRTRWWLATASAAAR